jgi:hypothetical protein
MDKIRKEGVDFFNAHSLHNSRSIAARMGILYSKPSQELPFQGDPGIISLDLQSPTLPSVLTEHGKSSAWLFNKIKFLSIIYDDRGQMFMPLSHTFSGDLNDYHMTDEAIRLIREEGLPDFLLVDLGDTDKNLHTFGCNSPEHLIGIEVADQQIGLIEQELQQIKDQRIIRIVTADHGCHNGYTPGIGIGIHGDASVDDMEIPLFFAGPGLRRNETIYNEACLFDLAPTIIYAMNELAGVGINQPEQWRGLVLPIFPTMNPADFPHQGRCTPSDR